MVAGTPGTLRIVWLGSMVLNVTRYWVSHVAVTVAGFVMVSVPLGSSVFASPVHLRKTRVVLFPYSIGVVTVNVAMLLALYHPCPCGFP